MKKRLILTILAVIFIIMTPFYYFNQIYAQKLNSAINDKDTAKVEKLLKQSGNVNAKPGLFDFLATITETSNFPPLIHACHWGNIEIVKLLIDNGADVNFIKEYKRGALKNSPTNALSTVLFAGTWAYSPDEILAITEYLLDNGLDLVRLRQIRPNIAAELFYNSGKKELPEDELTEYKIFLKFIEHGIGLNENDMIYGSGNFLHAAVSNNNLLITKYLIEELHYNIDTIGRDGQTALIQATNKSSTEMVKYLLDKGADKTICDNNGKTAGDYAIDSDRGDFISLFFGA
jgi:ankyrin repeat protein